MFNTLLKDRVLRITRNTRIKQLRYNLVNTNFRIIRTKVYIDSGPYNGFSIDITSVNTNSG